MSAGSARPAAPVVAGPTSVVGGMRWSFAALAIGWTLLIVAQAVREDRTAHALAVDLARTEALSSYNKDVVYRRWATRHGGVYVPVTESTPPNPYLAHLPERDIRTPSGRLLTLMNPAYMTRQVHELGANQYGARGHITSLNPLRPANKADAWEAVALQRFEAGVQEVASVEVMEDGEDYFRIMRPMTTEAGCLKCHEAQGYKLGEIRGGLSVSIPFRPYHDAALARAAETKAAYGGLWLLGISGLWVARRRVRRAARQSRDAVEAQARLELQLAQSQKLELVGRLAGGVAHDFNNMLTVIRGYTEVALEQVSPADPLHGDLRQIFDATGRSSDLTRQLLAFARRQAVSPQVLDLNDAVTGMLRMIQRLIGEDIHLDWTPGTGLWPVHMDPSQLDQLLVNLCLNARDAIATVGTLTIETRNRTFSERGSMIHADCLPGDYVALVVRDDGSGMDQETMRHVFEPFFTTKEKGKGTGLGLATVYGVVRQNGGFITLESAPGRGTAFTIFLPRHVGDAETPAADATGEHAVAGKETILLVEDEPAILEMTRRMLRRLGYTVLPASTPGEALRLAQEHAGRIDLLLTDVIMPDMNGRDLATALCEQTPGLRCLYMSGYTADVIGQRGMLDDGVAFIQKPFSSRDLAVRLREALARS